MTCSITYTCHRIHPIPIRNFTCCSYCKIYSIMHKYFPPSFSYCRNWYFTTQWVSWAVEPIKPRLTLLFICSLIMCTSPVQKVMYLRAPTILLTMQCAEIGILSTFLIRLEHALVWLFYMLYCKWCVFWPANGCSARCLLVKIIFLC